MANSSNKALYSQGKIPNGVKPHVNGNIPKVANATLNQNRKNAPKLIPSTNLPKKMVSRKTGNPISNAFGNASKDLQNIGAGIRKKVRNAITTDSNMVKGTKIQPMNDSAIY
jgi:hypothetical protein